MRRVVAWGLALGLTAALTALTTVQALQRYRELRSGWSWDLAYYNQWCWTLTRGDGMLSVQPLGPYGTEGPSAWKMGYLTPIRIAILPLYRLFPDPRTLLILQAVVFWWVVPAVF